MLRISNPKVSVIIPCYNYAHYLGECLESLMYQTYQPHEIIVVDDGGKDNCEEVCKRYFIDETVSIPSMYRPYPKVIYLRKENGGLSSARNAGIAVSTGEYIMALDADDKLVPGAISEHVKLLTDDMTIAQCALMEFGDRFVINIPNPNTNLQRVMQSNTIFCNALFPKKAWVEIGGFDESETMRAGYEDWEAWIRMLDKGYKVNTSDFIALRYRVHQGQMTQATAWPKRQKLYNYIYKKHKDLYERENLLVADMIIEN